MQVGAATWYSGSPEAEGFKHAAASGALLVTLEGMPHVRPVETGTLHEAQAVGPDFGWFQSDLISLETETRPDDLDGIDHAGALRQAAEMLLAEAQDPARTLAGREVAASALARLYALAQEVQG